MPRRSRGQGLGSALIELGTSRADAAGVPCYLETATQSNVDFYAKRGFEVTGQVHTAGSTIYGMVRQPTTSGYLPEQALRALPPA
ncbi:MAG: GNAT family N-acetyltransferase [Chloroflexi bacterium]|nr:GNAT family N-acetyltransferase [Chloroflexota bacterium]